MEINQIRYIDAISKCGTFSKAAEQLYITQPTLSQQVRKLEEEMGFSLFDRSTRKVSLTNEGKVFLRYASPVLEAYDALCREIGQLRDHQSQTIQLGVLPTFSHLNILEAVHQFQLQNESVSLNLHIENSYGLLEMLLHGQLDVAVTNLSEDQMETFAGIADIRVFFRDAIHVLVNASHPLSARSEIRLSDLADEPLILLGKDSSIRNQMELVFRQSGISPHIAYECPEIHSLLGMLRSGAGISFLSSRVAGQCIGEPIRSIPLTPVIETRTAVLYLNRSGKRELLARFADYFESRIGG